MRRLLRALPAAFLLLAATAGAVGAVQAGVGTPAPDHPVDLGFVDPASGRQSSPLIDVRSAYPGMPPHTSGVGVRNWGKTAVFYDLVVVVTDETGASPLAEVVKLTIRSAEHGEILYKGPLAHAAIASARPLAPGAAVHYRFTTRWNDGGPSDNQYQGQRTTFRLEARARPAG